MHTRTVNLGSVEGLILIEKNFSRIHALIRSELVKFSQTTSGLYTVESVVFMSTKSAAQIALAQGFFALSWQLKSSTLNTTILTLIETQKKLNVHASKILRVWLSLKYEIRAGVFVLQKKHRKDDKSLEFDDEQ